MYICEAVCTYIYLCVCVPRACARFQIFIPKKSKTPARACVCGLRATGGRVCVCVCAYIYISIYTYTHTHKHKHTHTHTHTHMWMYVYIYVYIQL